MKNMGIKRSCEILFVLFLCVKIKEAVPVVPKKSAGRLPQFKHVAEKYGTPLGSINDHREDELIGKISPDSSIDATPINGTRKYPRRMCDTEEPMFNSTRNGRSKRFSLYGTKWLNKTLTYTIYKYSPKLDAKKVDSVIAQAFAKWSEHTNLEFIPVKSLPADIKIAFVIGDHGDNWPFLEGSGTLAHAVFPRSGQLHINDAELWGLDDEEDKYSLLQVVVHEIGHSLGISHTPIESAIMYPLARKPEPHPKLDEDDILAIQAIYGVKSSDGNGSEPTTTPPPIENDIPDICEDSKIDTVFIYEDGYTYVFKGDYYWSGEIGPSFNPNPNLIGNMWKDLPGNIDAAFMSSNKTTYFFKGSKFWSYYGGHMDKDCPKQISEYFPGIPENLDAATEMYWENIYFFKDNAYWEFDPLDGIVIEYSKLSSKWEDLPDKIDAAITFDGKINLIEDDRFFSFSQKKDMFEFSDTENPRSMTSLWFNCITVDEGTGEKKDENDTKHKRSHRRTKTISSTPSRNYPTTSSTTTSTYDPTKIPSTHPTTPSRNYPTNNSTRVPSTPSTTLRSPFLSNSDICLNPKIDAMFHSAGSIYVFKGDNYWELNSHYEILDGYPKLIRDNWKDLPSNINAAVQKTDGTTYFFKGSKVWLYKNSILDRRFPTESRRLFYGIPDNIDAATITSNGTIFIFKGNQYWTIRANHKSQDETLKRFLSDWNDFPNDVDAALTYKESVYVFKDEKYYEFSESSLKLVVANPEYPRSTADWWFHCKLTNRFGGNGNNDGTTLTTTTTIPSTFPTKVSTRVPTIHSTVSPPTPSYPGICANPKIDTMFHSEGSIYVFKGDKYWKMNSRHEIENGYPKLIKDTWKELPNDIDAAVAKPDGTTYFFKGSMLWIYENTILDERFPTESRRLFWGIPDDIDAATITSNGTIYVFKNNQYWTILPDHKSQDRTLKRFSSDWDGFPGDIDAALIYDGSVYVFKDEKYYEFSESSSKLVVANPEYPRSTADWWFHCRSTNQSGKDTNNDKTTVTTNIIQSTHPTRVPPHTLLNTSICVNPKIDTMFHLGGLIYVFKGDKYWTMNFHHEIQNGYPKLIKDTWKELPNDIDAAVAKPDGTIYFFKGSMLWMYENTILDGRFPTESRRLFYDIPNDVDAATITSNGTIYVFKNNKYWTIRPDHKSHDRTLKRSSSDWKGLPNNIDAVFTHDGLVHIFKGEEYYQFLEFSLELAATNPEHSTSMNYWWLQCKSMKSGSPNAETTLSWTNSVDVMTTTSLSPPIEGSSQICRDRMIDTIFRPPGIGKSIFAFKGDYYWNISSDKPTTAENRIQNNLWQGLPGDIDAAFAYEKKFTYFIKGSLVWKYIDFQIENGYPRQISEEFPGMPDNIDSATSTKDGKIFFYKGDKYWMYWSTLSPAVNKEYPRFISDYEGIPNNIDAVLTHCGFTYYLKDDKISALREMFSKKIYGAPELPNSVADGWFGCDSTAPRNLPKC